MGGRPAQPRMQTGQRNSASKGGGGAVHLFKEEAAAEEEEEEEEEESVAILAQALCLCLNGDERVVPQYPASLVLCACALLPLLPFYRWRLSASFPRAWVMPSGMRDVNSDMMIPWFAILDSFSDYAVKSRGQRATCQRLTTSPVLAQRSASCQPSWLSLRAVRRRSCPGRSPQGFH